MTNEEAIDIIKCLAWHTRPNEEEIEQAIKALKQEPCDDTISRQAVLDCYKKWQPYMATRLWEFEQELSALPSVTPQSKMGQWLPCAEDNGKTVRWVCSSCMDVKSITKNKTEYCPVCGARMGMTDREIVDKLTELTTGAIDHLDLNDAIDLFCEIKRILSRRDRSE